MVNLPPDFAKRPKSTLNDLYQQATTVANGRLIVLDGHELSGFKKLVEEHAPSIGPEDRSRITGFYNMIPVRQRDETPVMQMVKPKIGPALLRAEFQVENEHSQLTFIPRAKLQAVVGSRKI